MLGIFLLYFIWKYYSDLAFKHNKNKWGYPLLGIATYYIGTFIAGAAITISESFTGTNYMDESNNLILSLIALPFGLLAVWGLYKLLQNRWKSPGFSEGDSLDSDLLKSDNKN